MATMEKKPTFTPAQKTPPVPPKAPPLPPQAPAATAKPAPTPVKAPACSSKGPCSETITAEQRYRMIQEVAYLLAEKDEFSDDPSSYWLAGEAAIDAKYGKRK